MPKRELTPAQVLEIRRQYREGSLNVRKWARAAGLHPETIRRAARGEGYAEIGHGLADEGQSADAGVPAPSTIPASDVSDEDLAASLARLTQAARDMPPLPREVDDMLADMTRKGAADAPRKD